MVEVKAVFGVLLLGVALWTVQPVLPASLALALWGALALGAAAMVIAHGRVPPRRRGDASPRLPRRAWRHAVGALLGLVGVLQIVGAASGGTDPLQPLAHFCARSELAGAADAAAASPPCAASPSSTPPCSSAGRPVMLDFYADWCVSCKEMERFTFADPAVQTPPRRRAAAARPTSPPTTPTTARCCKRFHLFGPPGTIFFDAAGPRDRAPRA